jgi:alpha-galactosidase
MVKRKILPILLILMLLFVSACNSDSTTPDNPSNSKETNIPVDESEIKVPEGYLKLSFDTAMKNRFIGFSTELDPHFHSQNVGLKGTTANGVSWECKAEDWDNIIVPRIEEMQLERLRVMVLDSWFAPTEDNYNTKNFTWDSDTMQSLYKVLDVAEKCKMKINLTFWGSNAKWLMAQPNDWVTKPRKDDGADIFTDLVTECSNYLLNTKKYSCIYDITLLNEPNAMYNQSSDGFVDYIDICTMLHNKFVEKDIRDKVKFTLGDDGQNSEWLKKALDYLTNNGIIDIASSHSYYFGDKTSNNIMTYEDPMSYKISADYAAEYNIPHVWQEYGTNNTYGSHSATDRFTGERGLNLARMAINMLNAGSSGASYWLLYSQYYARTDFDNSSIGIMDMGLWGFADENYNARPMYYAFSLLTRFARSGSEIYKIVSSDDSITAIALKSENGKWTYMAINSSDTDKNVSFVNLTAKPENFNRYLYGENNYPSNNAVITASSTVCANESRIISDKIPARSFVVLSDI